MKKVQLAHESKKLTDIKISSRNQVVDSLSEWWWCLDESLYEIASTLKSQRYAIIDHFLPFSDALRVQYEVNYLYSSLHLK